MSVWCEVGLLGGCDGVRGREVYPCFLAGKLCVFSFVSLKRKKIVKLLRCGLFLMRVVGDCVGWLIY